jgi:hypothetical protein
MEGSKSISIIKQQLVAILVSNGEDLTMEATSVPGLQQGSAMNWMATMNLVFNVLYYIQ